MRRLIDHLPKLLSALAVAVGLAAAGLGLSVFVEAWQTSHAWAGSAEALHADLPAEAPIWVDPPADSSGTGGSGPASVGISGPGRTDNDAPAADAAILRGLGTATEGAASRGAGNEGAAGHSVVPVPPTPLASPVSLPSPGDVELAEADFRFLDPPEPGAHARLAVTLHNHADRPTGPLTLIVPAHWLQSYTIFGAIPPVLDDRPGPDGDRQLVFGGLATGERRTFEVHVLASAEEVDGPTVSIGLGDGAEIGRAQPRTVAPRPRPGPARAVTIPKLGVRAAVVPVPWEPPPFVVGQLQGTAAVSEGNTVLVGHLRGAAGDVFARLDRLQPGDEVVATSRGLEYRFVVSEIAVRPYDDVQETRPTATPRLTMMTCTGTWNIARQDYSHRLWVVAEPPELAEQTIRANAERAAQAAREAEAAAAARAAHEAEIAATPASEAETATMSPPAAETVAVGETVATPAPADAASPPVAVPAPAQPEPQAPAEAAPIPTRAALAPTQAAAAPTAAPPATVAVAVAEPPAPATDAEIVAPGIVIESPAEGAGVPRRLVVRGRRMPDADARRPLWLVVRADVDGSRWYALDRPLDIRPDGTWETTVELGGAAGIHHELRVGTVDAATDAVLRRHASEHPGQPLDDLPPGFRTGARVIVERR